MNRTPLFKSIEQYVMTPSLLVDHVLAMIISGNLSFRFAEDPFLRRLLKIAFPKLSLPNRRSIARRLTESAQTTRKRLQRLLEDLDCLVSLVLDGWNSRNNRDFLGMHSLRSGPMLIVPGISCQWIDENWELQQVLLDFKEFPSPHTGENMAKHVVDTLEFYGIVEKLFCVTTDNATNNSTMTLHLEGLLEEKGVVWDRRTRHIRCIAHIINLVVKALLKKLNSDASQPFSATLSKIRDLAKAAQHGSKRPAIFRQACASRGLKPLRIPLDIEVRWNSTYRMLETALYLRFALDDLVGLSYQDLGKYKLNDDEWRTIGEVFTLLHPFYKLTKRFESNASVTEIDYIFYGYGTMFDHLEDAMDTIKAKVKIPRRSKFLLEAIEEAYEKLKEYYSLTCKEETHIYSDAMILNPRGKLEIFKSVSWSSEDPKRYVKALQQRFEERYCVGEGLDDELPTVIGEKRDLSTAFDSDSESEFGNAINRRSTQQQKPLITGPDELSQYLDEGPVAYDKVPIRKVLHWWKKNASRFPTLSKMARDVLAVPASGCMIEREFSISGRIETWQRNRLSPKRISDVMMYKGALKFTGKWEAPSEDEEDDWEDIDDEVDEAECTSKQVEEGIPPEWAGQWWKQNVIKSKKRKFCGSM
jgi:hypothetical protein